MTQDASATQQVEIEFMDGFVEVEEGSCVRVEEISGTTPLTTLQSHMLDPLACELARLIRELIASGELSVSEDRVICGTIGATK